MKLRFGGCEIEVSGKTGQLLKVSRSERCVQCGRFLELVVTARLERWGFRFLEDGREVKECPGCGELLDVEPFRRQWERDRDRERGKLGRLSWSDSSVVHRYHGQAGPCTRKPGKVKLRG